MMRTPLEIYRPFRRILIANRGEIACRVIRAARLAGLETVAVYSDQDRDSLHVSMADQAVHIGASQAAASYLNIESICQAIKNSGADAVHPGYGFLAENADFAEAVIACDVVWIGPMPESIRAMGNKARAKELMLAAGVRCIPGYEGQDQSDANLIAQARKIGFPVMVKAAAGGGGRGMRLVASADQLPDALKRARSESIQAFGSDELILERAITSARHIEIQVAGDVYGNVVHFGERDCSVQRRHQKIIEESPSPAVDASLRARMGAMAVQAARSINYVGVGTIECLLNHDGEFYFMEMNTRLQVEHAVTEAVYDVDLVGMQFELAQGHALSLTQERIQFSGHAVEVRLTAEDVTSGFLPQSGVIDRWRCPEHLDGIRIDHCLADHTTVSPYYDSMIAKIIAVGHNRDQALARLSMALKQTVVLGVPTNQPFLSACLEHPEFKAGAATTDFVERNRSGGLFDTQSPDPQTVMWAAVAALGLMDQFFPANQVYGSSNACVLSSVISSITLHAVSSDISTETAQKISPSWMVEIQLRSDGVLYARLLSGLSPESSSGVSSGKSADPTTWSALTRRPHHFIYTLQEGMVHVFMHGRAWAFKLDDPRALRQTQGGNGVIRAPLGARVASVLIQKGDLVRAGQTLAVLEAMKMEHAVVAPFDGRVDVLNVQSGAQVRTGAQLMLVVA
jgi:geranyl-CoA carboxylase alpha subunit